MSLCEVRVVTYKRPKLLERALNSLVAQTYQNWKALVFDDSPEEEARAVVKSFNDNRIFYCPNRFNLGAAKNIDNTFRSSPYIGGDYAFVLEDDNYLFPEFIADNIKALHDNNVNIVLRNQDVRHEIDGISVSTNETTRDRWFKQGVYNPIEVHARLFFCEGISNGGLFWSTQNIKSNLQVGPQVKSAMHQELFRTLQIVEPIYFAAEPLCAFTYFKNSPEGKRIFNTIEAQLAQMQYNRGLQSILLHLVKKYDWSVIEIAQQIATDAETELLLEDRLLKVFYWKYQFKQLNKLQTINVLTRHLLRYLFFKDPFTPELFNNQQV